MDTVDLRSSSNDLSSAPNSDTESMLYSNTITVSTNPPHAPATPATGGHTASVTSNNKSAAAGRQDPAPKVRRPRKKKDSDVAPSTVEKEKKPRKPRAAAGAGPASRKKVKVENTDSATITSNTVVPGTDHTAARATPSAALGLGTTVPQPPYEAAKFSRNGFSNEQPQVSSPALPTPSYQPTPPPPPPAVSVSVATPAVATPRSNLIFDPIRGVTIDRSVTNTPQAQSTVSQPAHRKSLNPSTSPAISSIINPPDPPTNNVWMAGTSANTTAATNESQPAQPTADPGPSVVADDSAMDVDTAPVQSTENKPTPEPAAAKASSKPRAKEQPPPLPTGSGLLSSTLFGGDTGIDSKQTGEKGPNIVLHVDLKDPNNRVINFARMAEDKYGFAALYPRQAAQKERLAKVAAAGAALERAGLAKGGTSASDTADEDLSVDIDRDSDNDGDVAMSGVNGKGDVGQSGTDGPAPRKRRKRKDEYDADDPFVDDSELLWEAHAAASKDGFFVYCGPLVPEGEKPAVERADGTVKRGRGRGRGGGPGSRGGRGAAAAAAAAAALASHGEGGSGRGGGPGSRGGNVTRKPRMRKAERQQRELEKMQREQVAVLAAKPPAVQPS